MNPGALTETLLSGHSGNDYLFHQVLIMSASAMGVWFPVAGLWEWIEQALYEHS